MTDKRAQAKNDTPTDEVSHGGSPGGGKTFRFLVTHFLSWLEAQGFVICYQNSPGSFPTMHTPFVPTDLSTEQIVEKYLAAPHAAGRQRTSAMTINKFQGESAWDAVVSHFGFDITEEDEFIRFIRARGHDKEAALETLERLGEEFVSEHRRD
jgi:hypothetical protein